MGSVTTSRPSSRHCDASHFLQLESPSFGASWLVQSGRNMPQHLCLDIHPKTV